MRGTDSDSQDLLEKAVQHNEERAAESLMAIRTIRENWESYEQLMTEHSLRIDDVSAEADSENFFAQRRLSARRELRSFVGQLVREQVELLDEAEREVKSCSEEELGRVRLEKAKASWD